MTFVFWRCVALSACFLKTASWVPWSVTLCVGQTILTELGLRMFDTSVKWRANFNEASMTNSVHDTVSCRTPAISPLSLTYSHSWAIDADTVLIYVTLVLVHPNLQHPHRCSRGPVLEVSCCHDLEPLAYQHLRSHSTDLNYSLWTSLDFLIQFVHYSNYNFKTGMLSETMYGQVEWIWSLSVW